MLEKKTLDIQTFDRDGNLKGTKIGLKHQTLSNDEHANCQLNSIAEVVHDSPNVFTLATGASGAKMNLFRDAPPSATLLRISDNAVLV